MAGQFLLFRGLARLASERNRLHRRHGWLRSLIAAAQRRAIAVWRLHLSQTRRHKTLRALSASTRGLACFRAWGTRAKGGRGVREVAGRASRVFERAAVRRATYAWARRAGEARCGAELCPSAHLSSLSKPSSCAWFGRSCAQASRKLICSPSLPSHAINHPPPPHKVSPAVLKITVPRSCLQIRELAFSSPGIFPLYTCSTPHSPAGEQSCSRPRGGRR